MMSRIDRQYDKQNITDDIDDTEVESSSTTQHVDGGGGDDPVVSGFDDPGLVRLLGVDREGNRRGLFLYDGGCGT